MEANIQPSSEKFLAAPLELLVLKQWSSDPMKTIETEASTCLL